MTKHSMTLEMIVDHAPIFYKIIQDYYKDVKRISEEATMDNLLRQGMIDSCIALDILPNINGEYEPEYLNNDDFRSYTIYHLGMFKILGKRLSWPDLLEYLGLLGGAIRLVDVDMSAESALIKHFDIDPRALTKKFINMMMVNDDAAKAAIYIKSRARLLHGYEESCLNYKDYMKYMKREAVDIIKGCNDKGFFDTKSPEEMAAYCISLLNGLPAFIIPYGATNNDISEERSIPIKMVKKAQKKLLESLSDDRPGIITVDGNKIDDDDDDDDDDFDSEDAEGGDRPKL